MSQGQVNNKKAQSVDAKKQTDDKKLCESYQSNPVLKFVYDKLPFLPYPLNIFIFSISFWLLFLLAYAHSDFLYNPGGEYPGFLEARTIFHVSFFIFIPALFIVMKSLYDNLDKTFDRLKDDGITTFTPKEHDDNKKKWRGMFESRWEHWIIILLIVLVIGNMIFKNITLGEDPRYPNSFQIYPFIASVNLLFFLLVAVIVGTFAWHLGITVKIIRDFFSEPKKLKLKPFHTDQAAGLRPLTDLTFKMNTICILAMAFPLWEVIISGKSPLDTTILGYVIAIVILSIAVFFFPFVKAHNIMKDEKEKTMKTLSRKHGEAYNKLKEELEKDDSVVDKDTFTTFEQTKKLYEHAKKMPVWPFDANFIVKLATTIGLPLLLYFNEIILSHLIGL